MTNSGGSSRGLRRLVRLALVCGAGTVVLGAGEQAYADPIPACSGVTITAYDGTAIVDTSRLAVGCVLIPGAELSMNGAVAPVVNFGVPTGVTTTFTYDAAGLIDQQIDIPSGSTSTTYDMVYDSSGRLISETTTTSPNPGVTTTYTYDSLGRLGSETAPSGTTTYTYDSLNRLSQETDLSGTTNYTYDTGNNTVTATREPGDHATVYTYDALNRVTRVTDPSSHVTTYTYDDLNRTITETDPSLGSPVTVYQYDANSNLISTTDPNNIVTTYSYDSLGRVSSDTEGTNALTDFVYSPPVPEPSSLLLLAGSLAGLLGIGRQRRRDPGRSGS